MERPWIVAPLLVVACSVVGIEPADAQAPGPAAFITTQGNDTISLERYTCAGNTITGTWVSHQSGTQLHDYVLTLGADGQVVRYEMRLSAQGESLPPGSFRSVSIVYSSDTATYVTVTDTSVTRRVPMHGAYPWLG